MYVKVTTPLQHKAGVNGGHYIVNESMHMAVALAVQSLLHVYMHIHV